MKFNRKWLIGALVVAVVAVPVIVKKNRGASATEVETARIASQAVQPTILASGTLAFRDEVKLTSEVTGKVREVLVKEGDTVEAGQLVLRLDPELYNNAIEREEASLRQSRIAIERQRAQVALRRKQFERSRVLVASSLIDRNRFDEDRNQLEVAEADLRTSEESLRRAEAVLSDAREQRAKTEIRSPISGRIVALPIKIGETAIPSTSSLAGAQLMTIADTSQIQAELKVDEADIAKVAVGQKADVFAAAYPDRALRGTVEQIALAPTIEGQGRAYKVTVRIDAPGGLALRSGMSVRSDIFLGDGKSRLAVPVEAVISESDESGKVSRHVWLVDGDKARKATIETGVSDDRWESVVKGVSANDTVIVGPAKALRRLRDGERVEQADPAKKAKAGDEDEESDDEKDAG
ncbi:MAG: efflux RND transporter periplasmic adaptor subunit [Pseudomonadota bacterium]